jgi:hypothetical protein
MSAPNRFDDHAGHDEFDEVEVLSERGRFWSPRKSDQNGHPHKLVLKALRWERVPSKYSGSERPVLVGRAKDGTVWKVACDNLDLQPLWTGDVKRWNDVRRVFEVVANWGRVCEGEVVAVEYTGDRGFTTRDGQWATVGSFRSTRKPPAATGRPAAPQVAEPEDEAPDDGVGF